MSSPRTRRILRASLLAALFAVAASGWFVRPELLREFRQWRTPSTPLVDDVLELIRRHYADSLGEDDLRFRAVTGILRSLPDPYASLLASGDLKGYRDLLEGSSGDVGLRLLEGPLGLTVAEVIPGSPSHRTGVRSGDRVLGVHGLSVIGWTAPRAEQALRGEPGTRVALRLRRPGADEVRQHLLTRVRIRDVGPAVRLLGPGVGYIRLVNLSRGSTEAVQRSVSRLVDEGARGVVLDLRGNPGGLLEEATAILELFLDPGTSMGSVQGRDVKGTRQLIAGARQRWPGLQVIVLVNPETASAAEIIASALQENHRAAVVGQRTFGKGHVQGTLRLSDELSVRISVAKWLTPGGHRLDREGGGVVPDVVVSPWRPGPGDDSLRAAIGARADDFRRVLEEAVRRGEWLPAEDSTGATLEVNYRALSRRARAAGFTFTPRQLAAGVALLEQEWAVLVAAEADLAGQPSRAPRVPDTQLLTAWRMLEGGEK